MISLSDVTMPDLNFPTFTGLKKLISNFSEILNDEASVDGNEDVINVFKWQDEGGVWHYSESDDSFGVSEQLKIKRSATLSAEEESEATAVMSNQEKSNVTEKASLPVPKMLDIPILNASETIEKAKQVEQLLQDRFQRQEKILN